ncbi:LLM class F420-dependent oxidoreductase [Streptantibioticus ferralitis]|uniref:LLM class F420-dependent oxidoreductase n=1 Tax=Streptantibioticus ferralitis TaxID=236510 RepID=A0ABT5Z109_9ACTN|nr:LLM class F420-dependent oxidoreductase [Streptantibioticus ferralitis]MDF2256740.1 LLM class F420-dependent oxidoreductase [Streptantibioticus ferralitis]
MALRLGLGLPQMKRYDMACDVTQVARAAEQIGYDSLWVFERVLFPERPTQGLYGVPGLAWPDAYRSVADPLVVLPLAAAVTERAQLGSSVLIAPLHVPIQLARTLATLDAASNGRVMAGLGTGWSHDEYAAASIAPFEQRGAVLDEMLDVFAAVWGPHPVSYQGTWTVINEAEVGPKPAHPIPVYLAATNRKALDRVARRADGWLPTGVPAEQLAAQWRQLMEIAASHGRDADALKMCVRANVELTKAPVDDGKRRPFVGTVEQIVRDVAAHADAGAHEVLLDLQGNARDARELTDLAARVYAEVRAAGIQ